LQDTQLEKAIEFAKRLARQRHLTDHVALAALQCLDVCNTALEHFGDAAAAPAQHKTEQAPPRISAAGCFDETPPSGSVRKFFRAPVGPYRLIPASACGRIAASRETEPAPRSARDSPAPKADTQDLLHRLRPGAQSRQSQKRKRDRRNGTLLGASRCQSQKIYRCGIPFLNRRSSELPILNMEIVA